MEDFIKRVEEIYGTYINSNLAFKALKSQSSKLGNDDAQNLIFFGGDPRQQDTKAHLTTTIGEFKHKISDDGYDVKLLSNLCIVAIYQLWEDEYREKIATSLGKKKSEIKSDIMGDIRHIRTAIIHNNRKKISDFNKIKILTFMQNREDVFITNEEFYIIIENLRAMVFE